MTDSGNNIEISTTAISKSFRLLNRDRLRKVAHAGRSGGPEVWWRKGTNEYHIRTHHNQSRHDQPNDVVVVVANDTEKLVVITQMGDHLTYQNDSDFERVSQVGEKE